MKLVIAGVDLIDDIKEAINSSGYKILAHTNDGFDAISLCREHRPDVFLTTINLNFIDGVSVSKIIKNDNIKTSIVFILDKINKDIINNLKLVGAKGFLTYPFKQEDLIATIELSNYIEEEFIKLKKEKELIEKKFEDRKIIDKAKGILMLNENLNEDDAYSKIRKYSMEKRVTMREIAEFIIISNEFKIK